MQCSRCEKKSASLKTSPILKTPDVVQEPFCAINNSDLVVTVLYDDLTQGEALRRRSPWPNSDKVFFVKSSQINLFAFDCEDCDMGGVIWKIDDIDWSRVIRIRVHAGDLNGSYEWDVKQ